MLLHSLQMGVLPNNATPFLPGTRFSRVIYPCFPYLNCACGACKQEPISFLEAAFLLVSEGTPGDEVEQVYHGRCTFSHACNNVVSAHVKRQSLFQAYQEYILRLTCLPVFQSQADKITGAAKQTDLCHKYKSSVVFPLYNLSPV